MRPFRFLATVHGNPDLSELTSLARKAEAVGCSAFVLPDHLIAPFAAIPLLAMVAAVIELVGGMLLVLGVFTRITAFICSGEMAVAYWIGHFPRGGFFPAVNGGDAAILFCFIFLYIAAAGPGPIALVRSDKL